MLSHGAHNDPVERATGITAELPVIAEVLVGWGLVVLSPWRRGYGRTGGAWAEGYGTCESGYPRFTEAGLETAQDIAAAVQWLRARPYIDGARIGLVGYSAGGWGSLALASRGDVTTRGVVMFAGGRGGPTCVPDRVLATLAEWGPRVKAPTLWLFHRLPGGGPTLAEHGRGVLPADRPAPVVDVEPLYSSPRVTLLTVLSPRLGGDRSLAYGLPPVWWRILLTVFGTMARRRRP